MITVDLRGERQASSVKRQRQWQWQWQWQLQWLMLVYNDAPLTLENGGGGLTDFQASQCIPMDFDADAADTWHLTFGVFIPLESMSWRL